MDRFHQRSTSVTCQPTNSLNTRHPWRSPTGITSSPETAKDKEEEMELDSPEFALRYSSCKQFSASSNPAFSPARNPLRMSNTANISTAMNNSPVLWSTCPSSVLKRNESSAPVLSSTSTLWSSLNDTMSDSQPSCSMPSTVATPQPQRQPDNSNISPPNQLAWGVGDLKIAEHTTHGHVNHTPVPANSRGLFSGTPIHSTASKIHRSASVVSYDRFSSSRSSYPHDSLPTFSTEKQFRRTTFGCESNYESENEVSRTVFASIEWPVKSASNHSVGPANNSLHQSKCTENSLSDNQLKTNPDNSPGQENCTSKEHDIDEKQQFGTRRCSMKLIFAVVFGILATSLCFVPHQSVIRCAESVDMDALRNEVNSRVHGQHLAVRIVTSSLDSFLNSPSHHLLVMSFHGWTGVGKNYLSGIIAEFLPAHAVHKLIVPLHFPHGNTDEAVALNSWILSNTTTPACGIHLFIVDEIDKASDGLLSSLQRTLVELSTSSKDNTVRAIVLLLSNKGASQINAHMVKAALDGRARESISYDEVRPDPSSAVWHGLKGHTDGQFTNVITVPFLPLERQHVALCVKTSLRLRGLHATSATVDELLNTITYFPADLLLFSQAGCRKVGHFIDLLV